MSQILQRYEARLIGEGKTTSTNKVYLRAARRVLERCEDPHALTKEELLDIRDDMAIGKDVNTVVTDTAAINRFAEYLNLDIRLKGPRRKTRVVKPLTREEIQRIVKAAGEDPNPEKAMRDTAMILFTTESAFRADSVKNARVEDLDFERGVVKLRDPKGKNEDFITLTDLTMRALAEYIENREPAITAEDEEYLFLTVRTHKRIGDNIVWNVVRKAGARAGITRRVYPHLLRHSKLTQLGEAGVSPFVIQRHANHSTLTHTMKYVHLSDNTIRDQIRGAPMFKIEDREERATDPIKGIQKLAIRLANGDISEETFLRATALLDETPPVDLR